MTTKNKFSENNFNATIGNTVLSAVFLSGDDKAEQINNKNEKFKRFKK